MRKLIVAILLVAVVALPGFSLGVELGVSVTPIPAGDGGDVEMAFGSHIGISPFAILYASWDALVMPPGVIGSWTGYYRPGFLNLFDAGLRLVLGPIVVLAEIGVNNVYVYKQGTEDIAGLGANLRLGAGLKFGMWGVTLTGTSVFPTMEALIDTLKGLVADESRNWAVEQLVSGLVPSLMAVIYF